MLTESPCWSGFLEAVPAHMASAIDSTADLSGQGQLLPVLIPPFARPVIAPSHRKSGLEQLQQNAAVGLLLAYQLYSRQRHFSVCGVGPVVGRNTTPEPLQLSPGRVIGRDGAYSTEFCYRDAGISPRFPSQRATSDLDADTQTVIGVWPDSEARLLPLVRNARGNHYPAWNVVAHVGRNGSCSATT